eukprot:TRINITY_DN13708_c0_g1_i1.p1 TRINITY_DN13708_c0_g1~~TRINITY_DN13708_c0_g1_i1.p1  ORF type:complete len:69 (-),score=1.72 TRINITY_DN13708_c0_g1_i1:164-370(-)
MDDPFLWEGRKFQFRTWAVIFSLDPLMVTAHIGHINRAARNYSVSDTVSALTNREPANRTQEELMKVF